MIICVSGNTALTIRVLDYVQEHNLNENEIYQAIIDMRPVNPPELAGHPANPPAPDVHLINSPVLDLAGGAVALDNSNKFDLKPSDSV